MMVSSVHLQYSTSLVSKERRKCWVITDRKRFFCALDSQCNFWRYLNNVKVFLLYGYYMPIGVFFLMRLFYFMPLWIYMFITQNNHGMVVIFWVFGAASVSYSKFQLLGFWLTGPTSFFSNCSPAVCMSCYLARQNCSVTAKLPALNA